MKLNCNSLHPVSYRVWDERQCTEIVETVYRVLEHTGCAVHNEEARKLLDAAGCIVQGDLVKIPSSLTRWAVNRAPSRITIYDREGKPGMELGAENVYFGPAITITQIQDLETGKRRNSIKSDAVNAAILMDSLENVSWVSACVGISDADASISDIAELHAILPNTKKPVMYWAQSPENLEYAFEMFEAIAGGSENLENKPFAINLVCPMDPLTHTDNGMAQIIYLARRRSPAVYISGIGFGLSGPITLAGGIVVGLADTLAGLVVSQLVSPGTPFIVSKFNDNVDMRNMRVTHSNPEMLIAQCATADVFRFMGLPFCSNFGGTDSGIFDQIASFDKSIQIYSALLSGTNMNFALGAYESGGFAKFEDFVFCNEAIGFIKILTGGVEISEDTLAEEVIDEVGPGGIFLSTDHTLDHLHEFWSSDILSPRTYEKWHELGKQNLDDLFNEKVKKIISRGTSHPLAPEIMEKLDEIMDRAGKKNK